MNNRISFLWNLLIAGTLTVMPVLAAVGAVDPTDRNAELFGAIHDGSLVRIQAALDEGANPKALDAEGMPVLLQAIIYCDANVVRLLLNSGADPNAAGTKGTTALVLAAGDMAKVEALVEKGANVNGRSGMGRTPVHAAAAQRDSWRIVKFLIDKGADPNVRDESPDFLSGGKSGTALMLAVKSRDNRTVQLLLDHGADVNAASTTGATALTEAIAARNTEAVRLLLARGVRVNYQYGQGGQTPLIAASFQECPEVVEMLLAAGADVNAKDGLESTALVWAAMSERDDTATVSALLRAGAKLEITTKMGETPLSWAKRRGNTGIVRLFESGLNQEEDNNAN